MTTKNRPFIFLFILVIIVLFLAGFRLGKYVERMDKTYLPAPSITPLPKTTTTPPPISTQISEFFHTGCAVSFLYPKSFLVDKNSSTEASLKDGKQEIYLTCAPLPQAGRGQYAAVLNPKTGRQLYFKLPKDLKDFIFKTLTFGRPTPTPQP